MMSYIRKKMLSAKNRHTNLPSSLYPPLELQNENPHPPALGSRTRAVATVGATLASLGGFPALDGKLAALIRRPTAPGCLDVLKVKEG